MTTKNHNRVKRRLLLSLSCLCMIAQANAQVELTPLDFDVGEWIDPAQSISFRLSHLPETGKGRLAFFIGSDDVSALVNMRAPGEFNYRSSLIHLPQGEQVLRVYLVRDDHQWDELASTPLNVLSNAGFELSEFTPRLDINAQSQQMEQSFDPNLPPQKDSTRSLNAQGGLATRHRRGDFEIRSNWNLVGASKREETLRFFSKANDAPKVDLSDYLVEVDKGSARFQLGHVSYGNNPLLMSGVAHRGVSGSWTAFERVEMSMSLQNGQSISGATNLSGLSDAEDNRIAGFGMGFDLLNESPGQLRVDLTLLDAKITSEDNFNFGGVTDAQKSNGIGIVLQTANASGRIRGNLAYARSTYENPEDPFLAQDFDIVESEATTDSARSLSIEWDILQPTYEADTMQLSLSARLIHNQADPFYSSVGAFVTPDQIDNGIAFNGQLGQLNWQAQYNENRDNLDDLDTVLTTLTDTLSVSLSSPIRGLVDDGYALLPNSININYQDTHQYGDNLPPSFDPNTHIPDQITRQTSVGLDWNFERVSLSYNTSISDQDNRQAGREQADFENTDHSISLNTSLFDSLSVNLSLGRSKAKDVEQDLVRYSNNSSIGLDWMDSEGLSVSANLNLTDEDDSQNLSTSENESWQAQLSYRFNVSGAAGNKIPVQAFIRYASNASNSVDNTFQFDSETSSESWNAGLNMSLF